MRKITFEACKCGAKKGIPHGYFFVDGRRNRMVVLSLTGARHIMKVFSRIFKGQDIPALEAAITAAGLPEVHETPEKDVEFAQAEIDTPLGINEGVDILEAIIVMALIGEALENPTTSKVAHD